MAIWCNWREADFACHEHEMVGKFPVQAAPSVDGVLDQRRVAQPLETAFPTVFLLLGHACAFGSRRPESRRAPNVY